MPPRSHAVALSLWALFLMPLAACGSTQYVPMPDLAEHVSDPGSGRVYVIRPSDFTTSLDPLGIYERRGDGASMELGLLRGGAFLCFERPPGPLDLLTQGENREDARRLTVQVAAGERHFVMHNTWVGFTMPNAALEPMAEDAGEQLLAECDPADVESGGGGEADSGP